MSARSSPTATRTVPPRSAARGASISSITSSTTSSSPLSSSPRITRPAAPAPKRGTANGATAATARSTSPRRSSDRGSGAASPDRPTSRSSFYASLARETEEKEALLVRVQELEATINGLNTTNTTLHTSITDAEVRIAELYDDQARMEDELASRNVVTEKLRNEIHELEKEERDLRKRYNDQTQTFDAERQAFYDSEQHLKSRIQSLTQAQAAERLRRKSMARLAAAQEVDEPPEDEEEEEEEDTTKTPAAEGSEDGDQESPEMLALRLELSTLTTSHSSLHSTLQLLQSQVHDLQRVNKELQEENESYTSLLVERTMTGQFDIRRSAPSSATFPSASFEDIAAAPDTASLHSTARSRLEAVSELEEPPLQPEALDIELAQAFSGPREPSSPSSTRAGRRTSRRGGSTRTASPKGETLADLPVAGPGLDLAAELGRAQSKDVENGFAEPHHQPAMEVVDQKELESLRVENKQLREANKALSLYASKILDRIIGHGGFESVLAADGEPTARTPQPAPAPEKRSRPQSMSFLRSLGGGGLTSPAPPPTPGPAEPAPAESTTVKENDAPITKRARRGLSIDWSRLSIWATPTSPAPETASANTSTSTQTNSANTARKLDLPEDEEDRITRARLNAEMRLHGINKGSPPDTSPVAGSALLSPPGEGPSIASSSASIKSTGSGAAPTPPNEPAASTPTSFKARLPFFGRANSGSSSSAPSPIPLTSETLQQAEAVANIVADDARERALAEQMAKDPVRTTSFTEMPSIRPGSSLSERHRRRRSGGSQHSGRSGASTLFSAGRMSVEGSLGEAENEEDA
ncbi:hypothetical protein DL93DRAFT_2228267 [Clavulina sp. PMI_390]|nr:hypothetical protein DL93DRAFT_2228267 [Clavulina sp. PMI_390]